ncbi:MAG TPA: xanthine dehydrogenase family protein molybdopterin-binding subunit [Stellaceae bacterium]|jgi:carbon-monoxide dehydrogenase large subunit|nr:xanthine dehydrogenase family protein molybdopterin-binding subunit [Stellaceae bacterium]
MGQFALGQSVPRTEDPRLLTGRGRYTDDFTLPRQAHGYVLRSPHAHARIKSIDVRAAQQMPGVLAVLTGSDWAAENFGSMLPVLPRKRRDGSPMYLPHRPSLANDRAMLVGDPIAFVVAESVNLAKDAAERIAVEYEMLPALTDTASASALSAPRLWSDCANNECFFYTAGDKAAVDAAFARAHHVTKLKMVFNRITANTMEPRGCIADYDDRLERTTIYVGTQRPHMTRADLAAKVFHKPENQFRIVAGDVGGSFGMKGSHFPEYQLAAWASEKVRRPVKWISERSEGILSDDHDRDHIAEGELALDKDGKFLALRLAQVSNIGAYMAPGGVISPTAHLGGLAGTYTTPAIYAEVSAVFTNTTSIGPFRGSGRPEASYYSERLIDNAAREMGIDRAELRRRNTVPASAMPYKTGLVFTLDSGEFEKNLDMALHMAGYDDFEQRRAEAKTRGRLRGIGFANIIEQTSQTFGETVMVKFDSGGTVTVIPGSISHGQGHDTMYKIILSEKFGVDADDIRVQMCDTDMAPDGGGTFASRTAVLGGSAATLAADKVIAKAKKVAAHMMEVSDGDVEFGAGKFNVVGTDKSVTWREVCTVAYVPARLPRGMEQGLYDVSAYNPEIPNFPNGCHVCEVEIDPETGVTDVLRYCVVDDVGTVINSLTLAGQIHGGVGQGIGQCFTENLVYDPRSGQCLTGSFMDYGMPRASDMCSFETEENPVPTKTNPLGAKGAGEAGNVGALAAIMNAVVDALVPLGITHIDMPATPHRVWQAIQAARK